MLLYLQDAVSTLLTRRKGAKKKLNTFINFVKKGEDVSKRSTTVISPISLLDSASDWELLVDFAGNRIIFPPEIYPTSERPDIIIFSKALHRVFLVELTCPAEEGIEEARLYKQGRYAKLVAAINDNKDSSWAAELFTIEAGARGFVAHSMMKFLRLIGMSPRKARAACKDISLITATCSYAIFLARESQHWDAKRDLLTLPSREL